MKVQVSIIEKKTYDIELSNQEYLEYVKNANNKDFATNFEWLLKVRGSKSVKNKYIELSKKSKCVICEKEFLDIDVDTLYSNEQQCLCKKCCQNKNGSLLNNKV